MIRGRVAEILVEMHKILEPGEYGLGTEDGSLNDKPQPPTLAQVQGDRSIEDVSLDELAELISAHADHARQEKSAWERLSALRNELEQHLEPLIGVPDR